MSIVASLYPPSLLRPLHCAKRLPPSVVVCPRPQRLNYPQKLPFVVVASSASFDESSFQLAPPSNRSKKSVLLNMIQEIEPLDVSIIQKDVPADTVDAMKRTISGMLGLLPSDQFHVLIEALWEPLSKLLVSSMMTGYTLRNAEYRLCLEKNLDIHEEHFEKRKAECAKHDGHEMLVDRRINIFRLSKRNELLPETERAEEDPSWESMGVEGLGEITDEAREYILHLKSRLSSAKDELCEIKRKNSALQMQHFVGEEKNDLLDYLRSLQPEKVVELSEPTSSELQETVHSVVHGLLATLSPKMHSKVPPQADNTSCGTPSSGKESSAEIIENTSLQFHPLISVTRDYLARLLFWCMLMGHHLRGLEYRLELMQLLTLSKDPTFDAESDKHVS